MLFANSILRKTGQWWKFQLAAVATVIGSVLMFSRLFGFGEELTDKSVLVIFSGMALMMIGFVFACLAIRCNTCGFRLFWYSVSQKDSEFWLNWLLSDSECPKCNISSDGKNSG